MVNAISGISGAANLTTSSIKPAPGGAQAQLAKLQSDLSDWVHCVSCHTPEGQAKIAEITAKIQDLQKSVSAADDRKQATLEAAQRASASVKKTGLQTENGDVTRTATDTLGQNVDEYA
jgi:hypothetical protein